MLCFQFLCQEKVSFVKIKSGSNGSPVQGSHTLAMNSLSPTAVQVRFRARQYRYRDGCFYCDSGNVFRKADSVFVFWWIPKDDFFPYFILFLRELSNAFWNFQEVGSLIRCDHHHHNFTLMKFVRGFQVDQLNLFTGFIHFLRSSNLFRPSVYRQCLQGSW